MKALSTILLFSIVTSVASIADVPPPPTPQEKCVGKKIGDTCSWDRHSVCQMVGDTLTCMRPGTKTAETVENRHDAKADLVFKPDFSDTIDPNQAQGCSNLAMLPSGFFSVLSLVMGVFLFLRNRRK